MLIKNPVAAVVATGFFIALNNNAHSKVSPLNCNEKCILTFDLDWHQTLGNTTAERTNQRRDTYMQAQPTAA